MRSALQIGTLTFAIVLGAASLLGCGASNPALTAGRMPDKGSFAGVYFSPQYGEMHLTQNGSAVTGEFTKDERSGKLQGEAQGDLLRFEWRENKAMIANRPQQTRGHGYFRYMVDASNGDHVLKGRWGLNDDDSSGGEWNAYKSRTLSRPGERRSSSGAPRSANE